MVMHAHILHFWFRCDLACGACDSCYVERKNSKGKKGGRMCKIL